MQSLIFRGCFVLGLLLAVFTTTSAQSLPDSNPPIERYEAFGLLTGAVANTPYGTTSTLEAYYDVRIGSIIFEPALMILPQLPHSRLDPLDSTLTIRGIGFQANVSEVVSHSSTLTVRVGQGLEARVWNDDFSVGVPVKISFDLFKQTPFLELAVTTTPAYYLSRNKYDLFVSLLAGIRFQISK